MQKFRLTVDSQIKDANKISNINFKRNKIRVIAKVVPESLNRLNRPKCSFNPWLVTCS